MLGVLGLIVPDLLGGPLYLLPDLGTQRLIPFTIQLLVAVGVLEGYRGAVRAERRGLDDRVYPGRRCKASPLCFSCPLPVRCSVFSCLIEKGAITAPGQ
jgi:hypothetical protein